MCINKPKPKGRKWKVVFPENKMDFNAKVNTILVLACGMFLAPNDFFIAISKWVKDESSIQ